MGNRAIIATENKDLQVYLHWNGGRDSVEAFLKYCELRGFRSPDTDSYGWARLCQVLGNFFGANGLSVGIEPYTEGAGEYCDNGTYIIKGWKIIGREFAPCPEQNNYSMNEMLKTIDNEQPKDQQLGEFLDAIEIPVSEIEIGDEIYMTETDGTRKLYKVLGIATDGRYTGLPYVEKYRNDGGYTSNPNNYPHGKTCYIKPRK